MEINKRQESVFDIYIEIDKGLCKGRQRKKNETGVYRADGH
jgi:hypothetical protein